MIKNKLFSKFNIKDYNNKLEKVLENKVYSLGAKNLLLNMFYKIENSYSDYEKTKRQVPLKNDFIQYLINTIQNKCVEIEIIKNNSKIGQKYREAQKSYEIENDKITVLENENFLLEAILEISRTPIKIPKQYEYIDNAYRDVLKIGATINQLEVIKNFNGWSWSITNEKTEKYKYNIVYQTLNYTVGYKLMYEFINNNNITLDYIDMLKQQVIVEYGVKIGNKFNDILYKNLMYLYINSNQKAKEELIKIKSKYKKQLEIMQNKEKFLEELTNEKKRFNRKINAIDKIQNDKNLLKKQYEKRSKKYEKLTIKEWNDELKKERTALLKKITECNELIQPKEYIRRMENIKNKYDFLESIQRDQTLELCRMFLLGLREKIKNIENKKEIIELIYELRYYRFIMYENEFLKDIKELKISFAKTIKSLIDKATKLKVIENVSEDSKENFVILKMIFDTQIIDLQSISIEPKEENNIIYLQYYDGKVLESKKITQAKKIKIKKKTKIFI